MNDKIETSGNALDAAPRGPKLPGRKKAAPPPLPKQEPAAAASTTPAPETPASAVISITEITPPAEKLTTEEVLREAEKYGFTPAVFLGAAAAPVTPTIIEGAAAETLAVEAAPAPAPELELTHQTTPQPSVPSSTTQLATAVVELITAEVKKREAERLPQNATANEVANVAPPAADSSTRMRSADTLLPEAEAIAADKNEESFFARGEAMGQPLPNRIRRLPPRRPRPPTPNTQENSMSQSGPTSTPAPQTTTVTSATTNTVAHETPPASTPSTTTSATAATTEEKKSGKLLFFLLGLITGVLVAFGGTCIASSGSGSKSDEAKILSDSTSSANKATVSASASATVAPSTASATASASATTATASEQPVSVQHHGRVKGPLTNEILAQVIAANHDKWSGTVDCFKTDWAPIDDDAPWIDCSSQKKKAIAGPQADCFKVVNCDAVFKD